MQSANQEIFYSDRDFAWPKFLTRDDDDAFLGPMPPPLPHGPLVGRLRRAWIETPGVFAHGTLALMFVGATSIALLSAPGAPADRSAPELAYAAGDGTTKLQAQLSAPMSPAERQPEATEPVPADAVAQPPVTGEWQVEMVAAGAPSGEEDELGLVVLRNLPDGISFAEGAPGGKGEWVMAAAEGDIDQLAATLVNGLEQPVTADVEMISRSGVSMGELRLELRKNSEQQTVEAAAAGPAQELVQVPRQREAQPVQPDTKKPAIQNVRRFKKVAKTDAAPEKRVANTQSPQKKMGTTAASAIEKAEDPSLDAGKSGNDGESPGLVSKFLSMFSGGSQQKSASDHEDTPIYGIAPRD